MIFQADDGSLKNLSAFGEWRYSMMGLAGRDSVCFALLDTESTLHGRLVCKPNGVALIQDLRLRCHGVMGQGQFDIDNQGPDQLFTRSLLLSTGSDTALSRATVSHVPCAIHMAGDKSFDPSTYTGWFLIGPATELYGPYSDSTALPMHNGIGIPALLFAQRSEQGRGPDTARRAQFA